ncbi:MAG: hypothetical protein KGQ26_05695, partial [Rhodospirillales bacterium]|nr:hypothetical protein [Rhodospirillales bacterium]
MLGEGNQKHAPEGKKEERATQTVYEAEIGAKPTHATLRAGDRLGSLAKYIICKSESRTTTGV